jgi:hypothetical protein
LRTRSQVTIPVPIDTSAPTDPSQPFLILYDVSDDATPPNKAPEVRRRVQVVCPTPEVICPATDNSPQLSCSYNGICGLGAAGAGSVSTQQTSSLSLSITPTLTVLGPSSISISQNTPYPVCSGGQTQGCDQGAVATVSSSGDLTSQIM